MRTWNSLAVCAWLALGVGCGTHMPPSADASGGSDTLSISPPQSSLMVINGSAATESFTATLTHADGTTEDVTASTTFGIDALGSFTANMLEVVEGGQASVTGIYSPTNGTTLTATAAVLCQLTATRIDPSLPSNTPTLFDGSADPTRVPNVVYPAVGVIMPRNLDDFEVHWTDASNNNIWEVSLHTAFSAVYVYVPATTPANWEAFLPTEWTEAVGNANSVDFQVRGVSTASPGLVGATTLQTVGLSNEEMDGGLYYWAALNGSGAYGIFRYDMSMPTESAQEYLTTDQTNGRCVACHVLSKDGTEMAVTFDGGGNDGTFLAVEYGSGGEQTIANKWDFGSFTADGVDFVDVEGGAMVVRAYADQSVVVPSVPTLAGTLVSYPDVAMDGTLVYTAYPPTVNGNAQGPDWSVLDGEIVTQTFDETSNTFGTPTVLVADANNNYYPSWSPDGQWILFNKDTDGGTSYDDASTELWVVKADGSAPPIRLAAADDTVGETNSWGRWAPFQQTYGANSEALYWITVSSKRDFGVRLTGSGDLPQIWMTPFFADRAAAGMDPTVPMFRLPFQDITSHNHIAQWTEKVVTVDVKSP